MANILFVSTLSLYLLEDTKKTGKNEKFGHYFLNKGNLQSWKIGKYLPCCSGNLSLINENFSPKNGPPKSVLFCIYLESTSAIDDFQSKSMEKFDSQSQSTCFLQKKDCTLQKLGINQELIDFTMESLAGPYNHQCDMYYVERSIEEVVQFSFHKSCSFILELCFDQVFAIDLEMCLKKNNLLNHQSLEYWMCLYVEYVNDQVNNNPRFQNN